MKQLILHPTDTSQWYALVNEAQASTRLLLDESTESYLVFLLMRFSQTVKLMESIVALDFLESVNSTGSRQIELLRDVGDKSLLLCGLFPGMASKHHVKLDYFIGLGQTAYLTAGELQKQTNAELFYQLSNKFITMQQVLQAMRGSYVQFAHRDSGIISATDLPMH